MVSFFEFAHLSQTLRPFVILQINQKNICEHDMHTFFRILLTPRRKFIFKRALWYATKMRATNAIFVDFIMVCVILYYYGPPRVKISFFREVSL